MSLGYTTGSPQHFAVHARAQRRDSPLFGLDEAPRVMAIVVVVEHTMMGNVEEVACDVRFVIVCACSRDRRVPPLGKAPEWPDVCVGTYLVDGSVWSVFAMFGKRWSYRYASRTTRCSRCRDSRGVSKDFGRQGELKQPVDAGVSALS